MSEDSKQPACLMEGFWSQAVGEGGPRLLGSRCTSCGEVYFPPKPKGWCVHCQQYTLETVPLSAAGKLAAVTVVRQAPAGGFYHGPVPYAYGMVDLPEGVRLISQIASGNLDDIEVGGPVELVIRPLYTDQEGREVTTFMFQSKA